MTFHTRYAVQRTGGWVGKNTGNHWQTKLPTYETVLTQSHARLYTQRASATKAANVVPEGKVVMVVVQFPDEP